MPKLLTTYLLLLSVLFSTSCSRSKNQKGAEAPGHSCSGFEKGEKGLSLAWDELPIKIWLDPSFPSEFQDLAEKAIESWNTKTGRDLLKFEGYRKETSKPGRDDFNVIYWTTGPVDMMDQARTHVHWIKNIIVEADMEIYEATLSQTPGVDLVTLISHELGHVLGLSHDEERGSLMQTHLPQRTVRKISEKEIARIHCAYGSR